LAIANVKVFCWLNRIVIYVYIFPANGRGLMAKLQFKIQG